MIFARRIPIAKILISQLLSIFFLLIFRMSLVRVHTIPIYYNIIIIFYVAITSRRTCHRRFCYSAHKRQRNVFRGFSDYASTSPHHRRGTIPRDTAWRLQLLLLLLYSCCCCYHYCYYVSICVYNSSPTGNGDNYYYFISRACTRANETIGFPERLSSRIWLIHFNRVERVLDEIF